MVVSAFVAATAQARTPPPGGDIVPPPQTVRHVGDGVLGTQHSLGGVSVPLNPTDFRLTNFWTGHRTKYFVEVYAGNLVARPPRGALVVHWTNPNVGLPTKASGVYSAPRPVGPLTLANVRGNLVYFRYVGGAGRFNLASRRFALR
jgi:hypothetical protein